MSHSVDPLLESAFGGEISAPGRAQLSPWEAEAAEIYFSLPDAPISGLIDAHGFVMAASERALAFFGADSAQSGDPFLGDFFVPADRDNFLSALELGLRDGAESCFVGRLAATDFDALAAGSRAEDADSWAQVRLVPREDGQTLAFFASARPAPALLPASNDNFDAALGGEASGIFSRDAFLSLLEPRDQAQGPAEPAARQDHLVLLNLDGFSKINDALGQRGGNEFLAICARTIRDTLRRRDPVARVSADEFAILIKKCPAEQAESIVQRLLGALERRVAIGERQARCTASAGIAPLGGAFGGVNDAWRSANEAMRKAKDLGGNRVLAAEAKPKAHSFAANALDAEIRLHEAISNGEFHLHYQPIFEASTRQIRGAEALMRWNSPQGPVSPGDFIPRAEETGLINHLGEWALRAACMQMAIWDRQGFSLGYVSVNASARQLHSPRFTQAVKQALDDSKIAGHRLVIEITESALALDPVRATEAVRQLCGLGVRFSIDDFGTGHACFANLKSFPVSAVKIDRGFVQGLPGSLVDQGIVASTLTLAKTLRFDAVGEGVETEEQFEALREMGCSSIQGFLLSRPLAPDVLLERLQSKEFSVAPWASDAETSPTPSGSAAAPARRRPGI